MKKKSILVLLIIMCIGVFTPFLVNAEECNQNSIKIQSVSVKDKSEYVEELNEVTFKDNKINLDLKMYDVGDYIVYTLKLKNESDENYYFDENSLNINSNYFDYSISYKDNSNKINPNKEKTIYLRVQYKKEVERENFFSGKYKDNNIVSLLLTDNKKSIFTNPLTGSNKIILLLITMIILGIYLYYKKTNNIRLNIFIIIGLSLLIPISTYALCEVKLDINSNITIGKVKPNPCTYDGELVQGAEYVNGQYTYRYMQEGNGSNWQNIENDGWGVILTDKESNDDVTTKLCTSINEKPIVSMSYTFYNSKANNIDLSSFDTSNVFSMRGMFFYSGVNDVDFITFDTSKVENMEHFLDSARNIQEVDASSFNMNNVKNIYDMFVYMDNLQKISLDNWDLSHFDEQMTYNMSIFDADNKLKEISLKNWKLPLTIDSLFYGKFGTPVNSVETIDVTGWDLSNMKSLNNLFYKSLDVSYSYSPNSDYEYYKNSLKKIIGLETWDTSNIEEMNNLFHGLTSLEKLDLSGFDMSNVKKYDKMLFNTNSLEEIILPKKFDFKDTIELSNVYVDSKNKKYNNLNNNLKTKEKLTVSEYIPVFLYGVGFNTKLKKLSGNQVSNPSIIDYNILQFKRSQSMPNFPLSEDNIISVSKKAPIYAWFDTGTIYYYSDYEHPLLNEVSYHMFDKLYNLNFLDLDDLDTSQVVTMRSMFEKTGYNSSNFNMDISNWNTSNVSDMAQMFYYTGYNATTWNIGDLSNWNTSNVTNMWNMFFYAAYKANAWNIGNLSNWNTSNVKYMVRLFSYAGFNASIWNIGNLSNWNTSQVMDMEEMFKSSGYNSSIWNIGDLSNWDTSKVTNMYRMFYQAGRNSALWNIGNLNIYNAKIDYLFYYSPNAKANLILHNNPKSYVGAFNNAATSSGSGITVNYASDVTSIDDIIATKSSNSNVVKGSLIN